MKKYLIALPLVFLGFCTYAQASNATAPQSITCEAQGSLGKKIICKFPSDGLGWQVYAAPLGIQAGTYLQDPGSGVAIYREGYAHLNYVKDGNSGPSEIPLEVVSDKGVIDYDATLSTSPNFEQSPMDPNLALCMNDYAACYFVTTK